MDELFRFVALRPPAPPSGEIVLDGNSPLARKLADARGTPDGREAMNKLAQSFARSSDFVSDASSLNLRLDQLASALEDAGASGETISKDVVERALGSSAGKVAASAEFRKDVSRLQDSLLAAKLAQEGEGAAVVLRLLLATDAIRQFAAGVKTYSAARKRLVLLPGSVFPLPSVPPAPAMPPVQASHEETQAELLARAGAIDEALLVLNALELRAADANVKETAQARTVRATATIKRVVIPTVADMPGSIESGRILLDATVISQLPASVRKTLADLKIDPAATTVPSMIYVLKAELGRIERMLA